MKIAISSKENHLDAPFASLTADADYFIIVDIETMHYKVISNINKNYIQITNKPVLQEFVNNQVSILVCGKCDSEMVNELYHAGIRVYHSKEGTIRDTIKAFSESKLISCTESNFVHNKTSYNPEYLFNKKDLMEVLAGYLPDNNEFVNTQK